MLLYLYNVKTGDLYISVLHVRTLLAFAHKTWRHSMREMVMPRV